MRPHVTRLPTVLICVCGLALWGCDDGGSEGDPATDAAVGGAGGGTGGGAPGGTGGGAMGGTGGDATGGAGGGSTGGTGGTAEPTPDQAAIMGIEETLARGIPGLSAPVHVVRTEADIPHVYASNRVDMQRVFGFITARDRFWMMDLARRLAMGRLSALVGDLVLETDITSRASGLHIAAQRLWDALDDGRKAEMEAFADGINLYIEAVRAGELDPPSEIQLAYRLLGAAAPADLMEPYTALDIMGFAAVVLETSTCARSEIQRTLALQSTFDIPEDVPFADQRGRGLRDDVFYDVTPVEAVWTARPPSEKSGDHTRLRAAAGAGRPTAFPAGFLERTAQRIEDWRSLGGKFAGSNGWVVSGEKTADGATLLAGDGHLPLAVPAYFHQAGLDTGVFGGDPWRVRGNFVPGLPALGVGTNGHIAWTFTCFYSDTVDYFREEVQLGDDGLPAATRFDGDWRPVARTDETYETRAVALLMSAGGDVTQPIFETFDGRRLIAIEGEPAPEGTREGVNLGEGWVVPGDTDGDGVITALSRDATFTDVGDAIGAYIDIGESEDMDAFRAAQRRLAVFGSHFVAGDSDGNIVSTGYHASPCRTDFEKTEDGRRFMASSDPQLVIDGTRFGGFELRYNEDGTVDDAPDDPAACMHGFDAFPHGVNPEAGYMSNGNNDPAALSGDGSLADDNIYIGGPWAAGFRAGRIDALLGGLTASGEATIETMAEVQADTKSATGTRWASDFIRFIEGARALADAEELDGADARVALLYEANADRFDEVEQRLRDWQAAEYPTPSGVETFYHQPAEGDADNAVATMIWNAWIARFAAGVLLDESAVPGDRLNDTRTIGRSITRFLEGRGPDNPLVLTSWNEETGESVFFDIVGTEDFERSDELGLITLADALDFLAGEPEENAEGGFGTDDMSQWLWGLRHTVRFESILAPFVGDVDGFSVLIDRFAITTDTLPIAEGALPMDDPRRGLVGFPRPGDQYAIDNADPNFRPDRFEYRNGPVKRMVIALHPDGRVEGQNVIPGGQSGLTDSPHFADQAALWLANEALPIRFHVEEVVEGAVGREVYTPAE
jgi:penicillin amidase